jgi:hypothetical protein
MEVLMVRFISCWFTPRWEPLVGGPSLYYAEVKYGKKVTGNTCCQAVDRESAVLTHCSLTSVTEDSWCFKLDMAVGKKLLLCNYLFPGILFGVRKGASNALVERLPVAQLIRIRRVSAFIPRSRFRVSRYRLISHSEVILWFDAA